MLKIDGLNKSFGDKHVLNDLNMEIDQGSIYGLVGINGAGKSTLLRLIAGVYKADSGSITFNGENTCENSDVRKDIAFVSDELYFPLGSTIGSTKKFVEAGYDIDEERYETYRNMFELEESMFVSNLSKGMKRRAALLFALARKPKLLLLDEAYDGLEPLARLHFKQTLADLIETDDITVVISSHNLRELEDICDHFGILEAGKIVSYGDLLESRNRVNKYQVAFNEDLNEECFKDFDVLHYEKTGKVYQLVLRGEEDETVEKLNAMKPLLIDVLPVTFEEMFIYELESRVMTK